MLARLDAWWDGREFDPAELEKAETEQPPAGAPPKLRPMSDDKQLKKPPPRIAALETIWGRGRWLPSSGEIDGLMLEAMGRQRGRIGKLGLVGVDAVATDMIATSMGEELVLGEWRMPCAKRSAQITDHAVVKSCDLDRITCFDDGSLKALLTVEAMTFVDHKGGLAARAYRALRDGGRWAFLDYAVIPGFKPVSSFASAWAEPQLQTEDQIKLHLETCGFRNISSRDVTEEVLSAARGAFARLGAALEDATAQAGENGRDGALMLQELSWEAASWKARIKALESGGLTMRVWSADKPGAGVSDDHLASMDVEDAPVDDSNAAVAEISDAAPAADAGDDDIPDMDWNAELGGEDMADEEEGPLNQDDIDSLFD